MINERNKLNNKIRLMPNFLGEYFNKHDKYSKHAQKIRLFTDNMTLFISLRLFYNANTCYYKLLTEL